VRQVFLIVLSLLNTICVFGQYDKMTILENSKGLCNGIFLNMDALIANRTPTLNDIKFASNIALPSKCLNNLNDKLWNEILGYQNQDKNNVQSIVNNYCSHIRGWVEYNPGTCQAGGPPPICSANHWYQDPSKAMNDFYNERNKIYNKRLKELEIKKRRLMEEACSCWLLDLKENNFKPAYTKTNLYQSDKTQSYQTTSVKIPCLNGTCPVGFKCVNGYCVESSIQSNLKDNTTLSYESQDRIKEKLKDIAIDKVLDYAEKKFKDLALLRSFYKVIANNPSAMVIKGVFEPTQIGTYSSIYQTELVKTQQNANQLEKLYEEQRRYKYNLNMTTANVEQRKTNIAKYRSELAKNVFNLNNAADGIDREKELGTCNCYNVLSYNNSLIAQALNDLIEKPFE
jgi:hypothetical protein